MWNQIPKRLVFLNLIGVGCLVIGVLAMRVLETRMASSKEWRGVSDGIQLAHLIEAYRADHGTYPRGFDREALVSALVPNYARYPPAPNLSYYSDGENYAIILRQWTPVDYRGPTSRRAWGPVEIRNGEFISWPGVVPEERVRPHESELRRAYETTYSAPRHRIDAPSV